MKDFDTKFQLIIRPFLVIFISVICLYSFFHWWLLIKNEGLVIDEAIANFAIPLVISVVPVLMYLLPRIKLLDLTSRKGKNPVAGYVLMACIAIAVPTMIAQVYLITATGELTNLTSINQISALPKTKYYTLKSLYIDKQQARPKTDINISGKHNTNYNMAVYMPCPIFDVKYAQHKPDTLKLLAWLGIKYQKTISNRSSAHDKQLAFDSFVKQSQDDFDKRDLTKFSYLDRIGPTRELNDYGDAITFSGVYNVPFIVLVPRFGRFGDRNGNMLFWLIAAVSIASLVFILMIVSAPLKDEAINKESTGYVFESYKLDR